MIDLKILKGWEQDWLQLSSTAIDRRRTLWQRMLYRDRDECTRAIRLVRTGRRELVHEFAYGYADQLSPDSSVATTPHLDRLLALANKPRRAPEPHRWFDALCHFDLTLAVAQIEQRDPEEAVGRDLDELIDFLGGHLFAGTFTQTDFYVYHDPANEFLVGPDDVGIGRHLSHRAEGRTRRKRTLACRKTRDGKLVFLDHRIKDAFNVWLKTHRQILEKKVEDPYAIHDRCGLTFVVEQQEDLFTLAQKMMDLLLSDGAIITEPLQSNFHMDAAADRLNGDSSAIYKVGKMNVQWRGREFELQFIPFHSYFNAKRSLSEANHALYKLRRCLRIYMPWLWPDDIYGVNWQSPHVITETRGWMTSKLGWHINNDHTSST